MHCQTPELLMLVSMSMLTQGTNAVTFEATRNQVVDGLPAQLRQRRVPRPGHAEF